MNRFRLLCLTLLLLALPLLAQEPHTGFAKPDTLGNPDLLWLMKGFDVGGGIVLGFFPDGQSFLSAGDGMYKIRRTSDGELLKSFPMALPGQVASVLSPDAALIAEGGGNGVLAILNAQTGEILQSTEANVGSIGSVAFSADHSKVLSVEYGGQGGARMRLWDVQSGTMVKDYGRPITVESYIYAAGISPDGQYVAVGTTDGRVYIWNLESGEEVKFIAGPDNLARIHFSHDGKYMATQGTIEEDSKTKYVVQLWRTSDWKLFHTLEGHVNPVNDCTFSPKDGFVVSTGNDGTIRVWNIQSGEEIYKFTRTIDGLPTGQSSIIISPDSSSIISTAGKTLYSWQAHWSPASSAPEQNDPAAINMNILPNPAGGSAVLQFTIAEDAPVPVHMSINDIQGRELLAIPTQILHGQQHISLNTTTLANGQYFCTVHINNNHYTLPFTIQH